MTSGQQVSYVFFFAFRVLFDFSTRMRLKSSQLGSLRCGLFIRSTKD